MTAVATFDTPCGPFTVMAVGPVVLASGWTTDVEALTAPIAPAARPDVWARRPDLGPISDALHAYFDGDLGALEAVAVSQRSGPFTEAVWHALRHVPPGSPVTYQALAMRCGRPGAARAVGTACGRNAAALFVPCHRAVRGDGGLGGFAWGLAVKRWLLDHEADQMGSLRGTASSVWKPPLT